MEGTVEFVKPMKYRRRSSFFQRSIFSQSSGTDSPTNSCTATASLATSVLKVSSSDDDAIKTEYLKKLKKEKENWEDLLNQKRRQEDETNEKHPQVAQSEDLLTSEDKKFLDDRPDYLAFGRLMDSVTEAIMIKQQRLNSTMRKVNHLITDCEEISDEVAEDVINNFLHSFDEFQDFSPES